MNTNQELRQISIRAVTGTALDLDSDWSALFDLQGIPQGDWDCRLLAWINAKLGTFYTEINGAKAAYAISKGAPDWGSLGSFTIIVVGARKLLLANGTNFLLLTGGTSRLILAT